MKISAYIDSLPTTAKKVVKRQRVSAERNVHQLQAIIKAELNLSAKAWEKLVDHLANLPTTEWPKIRRDFARTGKRPSFLSKTKK